MPRVQKWRRCEHDSRGAGSRLMPLLTSSCAGPVPVEPAKVVLSVRREFKDYRSLDVIVDSGAAESVIPHGLLPDHEIRQNSASLAGEEYFTACGKGVPCRGEQLVSFATREGHSCGLTFQVTDVTKPLLSVAQLAATGNVVTFDATGGQITNKVSGKSIRFRRRNGVYMLQVWVTPPSGFARQGNRSS